ncbi:MAG TPA: pyruvate kinase [Pyrinomonadaceae bacterium]|nr:pyruvate kinase [Pyrinomonadaceae bacterium]
MRRAKILATLGPAFNEPEVLEALIANGLNAVRINMSHGTQLEHAENIKRARAAAEKLDRPLAVLIDLSGPKIRTGTLKDRFPVTLENGASFVITSRQIEGNSMEVSTNFTDLPTIVQPGATILLDDGAIELRVTETNETDVISQVINGGLLNERKGINLPNTALPIPSLTKKDREDLVFAVEQNADYIALSFVRKPEDCEEAKALIQQHGGRAKLVAKIEKAEAMMNLEAIVRATDGVMVARGDLGVETSVELVPVYQKRIIEESIKAEKFVITATQMLQSMISEPRPTRAEASDVANAVWDGSDAVMLSGETATGKFPVQAVATMCRIIESAESANPVGASDIANWLGKQKGRTSRALCEAAAVAAEELDVKKTAVFTESGLMARRLSSVRPSQMIYALTSDEHVRNALALIWGVQPLYHPKQDSTEKMLKTGEETLLNAGAVENGETLVIMAGRLSGLGLSSSVVVYTVGSNVPRR